MKNNHLKSIPRIPKFKAIANLTKLVSNPIPVFQQYLAQYGDIVQLRAGSEKLILTTRTAIIEHILQKNNKNYWKSKGQTVQLGKYTGKGLLTSNGDYWLQQRRLIQPEFSRKKMMTYMQLMQAEIDAFDVQLQALADTHQEFDIAHTMLEITFRVVSRCLFSKSIEHAALVRNEYILAEIMKYIAKSVRLPFLKPWYILSGQEKRAMALKAEGDQIFLDAIQERKASKEQHNDLLDRLLKTRYEDTGEGMTDQQLLDESLILFAAGHETSSNALSWLLHLLAQHPEIESKLLAEIAQVLGNKAPTFEQLAQLKYTLMVIQEGMRLYPPAWITDRVALEDDEVEGYFIPKGTVVLSFIYGVHHSPDYWEQPEKFVPERFEKKNLKQKPKFAYMPFGGGPRLCIGSNFALMEMQLLLVHLVSKYKWTLSKEQDIDMQPLITLRPRHGIKMRIEKRMPSKVLPNETSEKVTNKCPFH